MNKGKFTRLTKSEKKVLDNALLLMLYIPLNVLISDYWIEDKDRKQIPEFIDTCLSLYESVQAGVVSFEDMAKYINDYTGITIEK